MAVIIEIVAGVCIAFSMFITQRYANNQFEQYDRTNIFGAIIFHTIRYAVRCVSRGILSEMWGVRALYFIIGSIICVTSLIGILLPYFKF